MTKPFTKTENAIMAEVEASTLHGKVCPRLHELARLIGVSAETVKLGFQSLRRKGIIAYETPYVGLAIGKVRVVKILATGAETARPVFSGRPAGSLGFAKADRNELERAKTVLRRLGHIVFDATVTDGSAGKGKIKVDNNNFTPAEVLARAAAWEAVRG